VPLCAPELKPEHICLEDIAHSLAQQCRYAGHTSVHYSTAEHCVLISQWMEDHGWRLDMCFGGLMHDAHEAYTGDISRPVQRALGEQASMVLKALQGRLDAAIAGRYGFNQQLLYTNAVKMCDTRILNDERKALLGEEAQDWGLGQHMPLGVVIRAWSPAVAEVRFLDRFKDLKERM
jgi:hypothetical protein